MLASVREPAEAELALACGVDVLDVKEPSRGALGAADAAVIVQVVREARGRVRVSATTGEGCGSAAELARSLLATARLGVDVVKVGLFEPAQAEALVEATALAGALRAEVFAVVMADRWLPEEALGRLARAGVRGVMLDTADKARGALPEVVAPAALAAFIGRCREAGLQCGLAGRLRPQDVAPLCALGPDYLGFRSALCVEGERRGRLDRERLRAVRTLMTRHEECGSAPPPAAPNEEERQHEPVA